MTRCGPGTRRPKNCSGFVAQPDPLRPEAAEVDLPAAPPFSADNQPLVEHFAGRGLHPYHLPMACDYTEGCATCQAYSVREVVQKRRRPQWCAARRCRARRPPAGPNVGCCAWRPTAPRCGR